MIKHRLITKVKIKNHAGETRQLALVETDTDYIIAHGYRGKKDSWDNGDYIPKTERDPGTILLDFTNLVISESKNIFTESIKF